MNHLLNRSLNEQVPVEIIYQGKDNSFTQRTVMVKALTDKYIKAYCYTKRGLRIFKIDSILAVAPIKERRERFYA